MAALSKEYKELSCRDFRADCDFTTRAETEEEVVKKCEDHACNAHGKCGSSPQVRSRLRSHIKDIRV